MFSNIEAENAAAGGLYLAQEKYYLVAFLHEKKGAKGEGVESLYNIQWSEPDSIRFLPRKCILQRCPVSLG